MGVMPVNFQMIVRSRVEMWNQKFRLKHIYKVRLFCFPQSSKPLECMYMGSYPLKAGTLQYTSSKLQILTLPVSLISKQVMGTQWMRGHGPELADVEFGQDMTKN